MTKEKFKEQLVRAGMYNKEANKLAKALEGCVFDYLYENGFEIWNAGCTLRLKAGSGDKDWCVCEYDNPLHPKKEYSTLQGALKYMEQDDNN